MFGKVNDSVALAQYSQSTGNKVEPPGFFLHPSGALGGAADGIIWDQKKIIKIKCPYTYRESTNLALDFMQGLRRRNFCIKYSYKTENVFPDTDTLKGFRYYLQIQGCMQFIWAETCDLVVWSPGGFLIITIDRFPSWQNTTMKKLLKIWCQNWVPALLKEKHKIICTAPRKVGFVCYFPIFF